MCVGIKGIKMPESCSKCDLEMAYDGYIFCAVPHLKGEHREFDRKRERHPKCPLIEIPVPHGRLIDINDVVSAKRPTDREPEKNEAMALYKAGWDTAIEAIIENAPTIIEAEGNNDEWAV